MKMGLLYSLKWIMDSSLEIGGLVHVKEHILLNYSCCFESVLEDSRILYFKAPYSYSYYPVQNKLPMVLEATNCHI